MAMRFGGVGVTLPLNQLGTNSFELQAGAVFYIPPGTFNIAAGPYSTIQVYDPVMTVWRPAGWDTTSFRQVDSDGSNYRIANQTGCPVAAILTTAGTGYTSAPTVTAGAGGSTWQAIMGAAISTTVSIVSGGSNYVYPPMVVFSAPGSPGICASGYATLTSGAVSSITVTDQGGGYLVAPTISLQNDSRDTTGANAIANAALSTLQTVTGVICTNHGIPITGGTVPALTFAGGGGASAAATMVMEWTVTSYAVTNGGSGYNGQVEITTIGTGIPTTASAYTNPHSQASFLRTRAAVFQGALTANAIVAAGQVQVDGGILGNAPTPLVIGLGLTVATLTLGLAGANDFFWMQAG